MEKQPDVDIEIYNEEQRWWADIKENATATIRQLENSLKLNKEMIILAESKIAEKQNI